MFNILIIFNEILYKENTGVWGKYAGKQAVCLDIAKSFSLLYSQRMDF